MHDLYAPATNASKYGSIIPYRRACSYLKMKQFKYYWDDYAKTPYILNGRQWLGVEDKKSVRVRGLNENWLLKVLDFNNKSNGFSRNNSFYKNI